MTLHHALSPLQTGLARLIALFIVLTGLACVAGAQISAPPQMMQPPASGKPTPTGNPTPPAAPAPASPAKPSWKELSPTQQQALQPLAAQWETLNADRKRKWLAVSKNYASLSATEQLTLHSRMREWALLSPQQRNQARLNFTETKKIAPEDKAARWEAYQSLSIEEKRRLAAKVPSKPVGVAAVKPVQPEKLAQVPPPRRMRQDDDAMPAARAIHRNTLLPRTPAPVVPSTPAAPAPNPANSNN